MIEADYYELLGVARGADDNVIKTAYRRLAMQCHPDKNPGCQDSENRFKAINEAYFHLKDPQKRAAYDRYGKAAFQDDGIDPDGGTGSSGFADIFENIFGEFMGRGRGRDRDRSSHAVRGADLRGDFEITLEDAYTGTTTDVDVATDVSALCAPCHGTGAVPGTSTSTMTCDTCRGHGKVQTQQGASLVEQTCLTCRGIGRVLKNPCEVCHGTGSVQGRKMLRKVKIPPGVDEGSCIRLSGEGEPGIHGGPPGDLYIFIRMKPHKLWRRQGANLYAEVPVPFTTLALGGQIEVPCPDCKVGTVAIPAVTQGGQQFVLHGRGMPVLNSSYGDLIIQVEVEMPTKLNKRQRELLQEFQALDRKESSISKSSGLFSKKPVNLNR